MAFKITFLAESGATESRVAETEEDTAAVLIDLVRNIHVILHGDKFTVTEIDGEG